MSTEMKRACEALAEALSDQDKVERYLLLKKLEKQKPVLRLKR